LRQRTACQYALRSLEFENGKTNIPVDQNIKENQTRQRKQTRLKRKNNYKTSWAWNLKEEETPSVQKLQRGSERNQRSERSKMKAMRRVNLLIDSGPLLIDKESNRNF